MPKSPGDRPLKYSELVKKLKNFGVIPIPGRGKGSNRGFYHPNIMGKPTWFFVKCHGEGTELSKPVVSAARRRFNIKSEEFY